MSAEAVMRQGSRVCRSVVAMVFALCLPIALLHAQSDSAETAPEPGTSRNEAPLVYIDCNSCDMAHIRREITFVNYVRDPVIAQVYVLVTDETAGSGGRSYSLSFTGRQQFDGLHQALTYTSSSVDTPAEVRDGQQRACEALHGRTLPRFIWSHDVERVGEAGYLARCEAYRS